MIFSSKYIFIVPSCFIFITFPYTVSREYNLGSPTNIYFTRWPYRGSEKKRKMFKSLSNIDLPINTRENSSAGLKRSSADATGSIEKLLARGMWVEPVEESHAVNSSPVMMLLKRFLCVRMARTKDWTIDYLGHVVKVLFNVNLPPSWRKAPRDAFHSIFTFFFYEMLSSILMSLASCFKVAKNL